MFMIRYNSRMEQDQGQVYFIIKLLHNVCYICVKLEAIDCNLL